MKKVTFLAGLAAVMMASCNNEEIDITSVPIDLHFGVAATTTRASITKDEFEEGNQVGVYMGALKETDTQGKLVSTGKFNNVPYQLNGTSWNGDPIYWQSTTEYHTLYAYAPYSETISGDFHIEINVPADQKEASAYKNVDFLWGQLGPMLATADEQTFELGHQMSQLMITLTASDGMEKDELDDMTLELKDISFASKGSFDLNTGVCTANNVTTPTTLTPYRPEDTNTFYAIVLPGTVLKDAKIVLTAKDNTTYSYTIKNVTTAQGYKYTFDLQVKKGTLQLAEKGFTINSWGGNTTENGDATMDTTTTP